jgi:hypothetical protein
MRRNRFPPGTLECCPPDGRQAGRNANRQINPACLSPSALPTVSVSSSRQPMPAKGWKTASPALPQGMRASLTRSDRGDISRPWPVLAQFSTALPASIKKLVTKREKSIFPLADQPEPDYKGATPQAHAPFVYRLGRQIFILKRGVRLP